MIKQAYEDGEKAALEKLALSADLIHRAAAKANEQAIKGRKIAERLRKEHGSDSPFYTAARDFASRRQGQHRIFSEGAKHREAGTDIASFAKEAPSFRKELYAHQGIKKTGAATSRAQSVMKNLKTQLSTLPKGKPDDGIKKSIDGLLNTGRNGPFNRNAKGGV
jgi:hypothetical protein